MRKGNGRNPALAGINCNQQEIWDNEIRTAEEGRNPALAGIHCNDIGFFMITWIWG
jgi:hypothetical protein